MKTEQGKMIVEKMMLSIKNTGFKAKICLSVYAIIQVILLIFLRKYYLLTVYQTAIFYFAVSFTGILILFLEKNPMIGSIRNTYLLFWSAIQGIIVLGFLTKGTFYLTITQLNIVQVINFFLGFALYWICYMIFRRVHAAVGIGNILLGIMGLLNRYLVRFRGAPFQISDIQAARTAGNVMQNYDYTPDVFMVVAVIDLLIWYVLIRKLDCDVHALKLPDMITQKDMGGSCDTLQKNHMKYNNKQQRAYEKQPFSCNNGSVLKILSQNSLQNNVIMKIRNRYTIFEWTIIMLTSMWCIMLFLGPYPQLYAKTGQFVRDNYLADLLADIRGSADSYPEGYTVESASQILCTDQEILDKKAAFDVFVNGENIEEIVEQSHIIVIMNEAFSDLRVLGNIETNTHFLEYWDSLQENCIKGYVNVSVLGGTTANSEYEFLTSDASSLYMNSSIPYNKYFRSGDYYPGLTSILGNLGYETTAFHPYLSSGWNRTQVYRAMQFENIIFSEDLEEELDTLRIYVSDEADYHYIQKWFEKKENGKPQFFFNVTMQNHGGYTYEGEDFETTVQLLGDAAGKYPQAEQYLSLIKASDEALKGLLTYFENYGEPVIVVLFGDHQPSLEPEFYSHVTGKRTEEWDISQRMNQYKTPFLIWHNYDTEYQEYEEISLNYLASVLMKDAGLPMSLYQEYLLEQMEEMPVVNAVGVKDKEGNLYPKGSAEYGAMTEEMQRLVYWHTVDK